MGKGAQRPNRYSRVSTQTKFRLVMMTYKNGLSIKKVIFNSIQAAMELGINYSTAKTILFFYRRKTERQVSTFHPIDEHTNRALQQCLVKPRENGHSIQIVSLTAGKEAK